MSIFVVIFFLFLLSLRTWQVVRGFDKQDILDQYDFNKSLVPIESYELSMEGMEKNYYRTIALEGHFMQESYLLDNRIYRQKSGYEIFSLFKTDKWIKLKAPINLDAITVPLVPLTGVGCSLNLIPCGLI